MAKTKISIRKKRQIACLLSLFLTALSFLMVFFEFSLTFNGGWDDLNYTIIFLAPVLSAFAMIISLYDMVKYRASKTGIVPALSMVAISALFFCYVMLYTSAKTLALS